MFLFVLLAFSVCVVSDAYPTAPNPKTPPTTTLGGPWSPTWTREVTPTPPTSRPTIPTTTLGGPWSPTWTREVTPVPPTPSPTIPTTTLGGPWSPTWDPVIG